MTNDLLHGIMVSDLTEFNAIVGVDLLGNSLVTSSELTMSGSLADSNNSSKWINHFLYLSWLNIGQITDSIDLIV